MKPDQFFNFLFLLLILWLLWRWVSPSETPEQQAERLQREALSRTEAADAERKRHEAEAETRRIAEAVRARMQAEMEKARLLTELERTRILSTPIDVEILRDMRDFLKSGQFFGEEHSPLAYVGYRVGKTNGLPVWDRHRRLKACFQVDIPKELADKYQSWGKPVSRRRFDAISQHLSMLADMRRNRRNYEVAVADWEADQGWFKEEYTDLIHMFKNAKF